ncbi:MAG: hypothetical protein NPIRA03_25920 [Nitrospirales bacterium]|nr:MAG: hypothetical protein NPIRA03_25920 [Nitrospirales bacterium]
MAQVSEHKKKEPSTYCHPEPEGKDLCPDVATRVQRDLGHHIFPSGREQISDWQGAKEDLR